MAKLKKLEKPGIEGIEIRPVLNGYKVSVGCQELVFTDDAELVKYLGAYLKDPKEFKEMYSGTMVFRYSEAAATWTASPEQLGNTQAPRKASEAE